MDPHPNSPSLSAMLLDENYDMDFLSLITDYNSIVEPSPLRTMVQDHNGSPSILAADPNETIAQVNPSFPPNNQIHPTSTMLAPSIDILPYQHTDINSMNSNAFNISSGSMEPFAMGAQILPSNIDTQTFQFGEKSMQSFVNQSSQFVNPQEVPSQMSFQSDNLYMNPDHELPPPAYFQRHLLGQIPLDDHELFHQFNYLNEASSQNLQLPNMDPLAQSQFPTVNFPMNATLDQSLDQFPMNAFGSQLHHGDNNYVPFSAKSSLTNFANSVGDIMNHDPAGIACFLAGVVRPSPETEIHKCSICCLEFPNAQAFGGHMKSHSKRKMEMEEAGVLEKGGKSRKARSAKKEKASSTSSSKSKKPKGLKGKN